MGRYAMAIEGMSCGHCLNAVNRALSAVPGVTVASVQIGKAVVDLPVGASTDALVTAVEEAGYRVSHVAEQP